MKTKIIKIDPRSIRQLEINARYMKHEEFQRLVNNVKNDGDLTSVPFCCLENDGVYLVLSGNHRVQAAIQADLKTISVMVTDDKLTHSQKIALQLSHNSIAGQDDLATLKQLYESIDEFDYKMYSGLDDKTLELLDKVGTEGMSVFGLDFQLLNIVFLPNETKDVARIIKQVKIECGKNRTLLARFSEYDKWLETLDDISSASKIKNAATAILAMLLIVENHMDEIKDLWYDNVDDKQWVPISSITGRGKVKIQDGRTIDKAIERLISKGEVKKADKEKGLSLLAQKYLDSEKEIKNSKKSNKEV